MLATHFGGHPLIEQNLSSMENTAAIASGPEQREAVEFATRLSEDTEELAEAEGRRSRSEQMSIWLASRYAMNMREIAWTKGAERWRLLRQMCTDVVSGLRRADQHNSSGWSCNASATPSPASG